MDPSMNFGSGAQLLGQGAGPSIESQLMARQTGQAGVTSQQSPASAGFDPNAQAPMPGQSPQPSPMSAPGGLPSAGGQPTVESKGLPHGDPEATIISRALSKRLTG